MFAELLWKKAIHGALYAKDAVDPFDDSFKVVSDEQNCLFSFHFFEQIEDETGRWWIDVGGWFIEKENRWICEERSCKQRSLSKTTRERSKSLVFVGEESKSFHKIENSLLKRLWDFS